MNMRTFHNADRGRRGIALVITLIMLAVATVMAVAFLAISRSQKAAVAVVQDQTDARLMADAAVARAQATVIGGMLAFTNPYAFDFFVSTNLIDPAGFDSTRKSQANVAYHRRNGAVLDEDELHEMLSRLQFDPRPPVFVRLNNGNQDFRYYLDFNRNGRFETNGLQPVLDRNGVPLRAPNSSQIASNHFVGDPEWIGVLEHPEAPHSGTNRFVGRYAFLVLPSGKSLDLNFIHNRSKASGLVDEGFLRNHGMGSWELNLAGFLCDLNENLWPANQYTYFPDPVRRNQGAAFGDAFDLLNYRYSTNLARVRTLQDSMGLTAARVFEQNHLDEHADGVMLDGTILAAVDGDRPGKAWAGSDSPQAYFDAQEVFDPFKTSFAFTNKLGLTKQSRDSYNRYTYYRLLSQIGTDSASTPAPRLHLNYKNIGGFSVSNVLPWEPVNFFTNAADRMLRASMRRAVDRRGLTNLFIGGARVRPEFALSSIMVYPTNEYSADVHRTLQLAANIHDSTTNRGDTLYPHLPSVFRPRFRTTGDAVYIRDFVEVTNTVQLDTRPWRDLRLPADRARLTLDDNVYGIPWVVGAKKGLPNFNEFMVQTLAAVTRKLEVRKRNINGPPTPANLFTNQMYLMSISNVFGFEAWNSYTQAYPRPLRIDARVQSEMYLATSNQIVWPANGRMLSDARGVANWKIPAATWLGGQMKLPLSTNLLFLPDSILLFNPPRLRPAAPNPGFDATPGFPVLDLDFRMTNRIQFIVIDEGVNPHRIIDFVNLENLASGFNLTTNLMGSGVTGAGRDHIESGAGAGSALSDYSFWVTNRLGGPAAPSFGVSNQVYVSMNKVLSPAQWRDASGDPRSGQDVEKSIDGFRRFLGFPDVSGRLDPDRSAAKEVPFSPTRRFFQETKWQANDPLVHYHLSDLASPDLTLLNFIKPAQRAVTNSNLGLINDRFFPWGGNTNKTPQPMDFDLSVKDPLVHRPDDWEFPTNKFPNIGWLGRVHRGTPWQTVYLKAAAHELRSWVRWAGTRGTHPTNDWQLLDLFTVAPNDNASRGLMAVNQTNIASWSALLSGINVLSNNLPSDRIVRGVAPSYARQVIQPNSLQLRSIVQNVIEIQRTRPNGVFHTVGDLMSVPALSVNSPFLNTSNANQMRFTLRDEVIERIPEQILSLLKRDEPRLVVYAFGQSLKPAPNSLVVDPGNYFQLCTNYQITGETAVKAVLRFDSVPYQPQAVIESFHVIPPE